MAGKWLYCGMEDKLIIAHVQHLCDANGIHGKKRPKAIVFELSHYDSKTGLNLIICLQNVGTKFETARKFRDGGKLDGHFAFENDAVDFAQDEQGGYRLYQERLVGEGLAETMAVFEEMAVRLGYAHCNSMGVYPASKKKIIFHCWMGNE